MRHPCASHGAARSWAFSIRSLIRHLGVGAKSAYSFTVQARDAGFFRICFLEIKVSQVWKIPAGINGILTLYVNRTYVPNQKTSQDCCEIAGAGLFRSRPATYDCLQNGAGSEVDMGIFAGLLPERVASAQCPAQGGALIDWRRIDSKAGMVRSQSVGL